MTFHFEMLEGKFYLKLKNSSLRNIAKMQYVWKNAPEKLQKIENVEHMEIQQ